MAFGEAIYRKAVISESMSSMNDSMSRSFLSYPAVYSVNNQSDEVTGWEDIKGKVNEEVERREERGERRRTEWLFDLLRSCQKAQKVERNHPRTENRVPSTRIQ